MYLPRLNTKKILAVCVLVVVLWLFVGFVEVPKAAPPRITAFESRLEKIQQQMDLQIEESNKLLGEVREHIAKNDKSKDGKVQDSALEDDGDPDFVGDSEGHPSTPPVLPVLVMSCDRPTVSRCLEKLLKYRPDHTTFPIIVSQDCGNNETYKVIKGFVDTSPAVSVILQPDLSEIPLPRQKVKFRGYYKIARHFKFALKTVLTDMGHDAVIIVEDDLDISPDFFDYFLGTYHLLLKDPTIWCISAWNDNGKRDLIQLDRPELLHRTDFFPGLGWMLRRDTWLQLQEKWPEAFFDDWLRNPENTGGRACIRPEISRTYSFGKIGVSKGLFFEKHLRFIELNTEPVKFTEIDLSYLIKSNYDEALENIYTLPPSSVEAAYNLYEKGDVRIPYANAAAFRRAAKRLGAMDDFRSGIPRTAYRGIVSLYIRGKRVYLTPDFEWTKYDPGWG